MSFLNQGRTLVKDVVMSANIGNVMLKKNVSWYIVSATTERKAFMSHFMRLWHFSFSVN